MEKTSLKLEFDKELSLSVNGVILTNEAIRLLLLMQKNHQVYLDFLNQLKSQLIELSFEHSNIDFMEYLRNIKIFEDIVKSTANLD